MKRGEHDDAEAFARLALMVSEKVDMELEWYAEDTEARLRACATVAREVRRQCQKTTSVGEHHTSTALMAV